MDVRAAELTAETTSATSVNFRSCLALAGVAGRHRAPWSIGLAAPNAGAVTVKVHSAHALGTA